MKQNKCIWQFHDKSNELKDVFDYFKFCTNEMIRVSIEKNLTSRGAMHNEFYKNMRTDFMAKYIHGAVSVAKARVKQYRNAKKKKPDVKIPYVKRNIVTMDNQSFKIENDIIKIPIKPKQYLFIKLTSYVIKTIKDTKLGSMTLTPEKLIISYSKEIQETKPEHYVGIDRNLDNATSYDTTDKFMIYDLSKTNHIKETYKNVKSKLKRNDVRIRKKIFSKYGKKQTNKVNALLHITSKKIVSQNQGIVMENLKGIRKLYRKGNGQGNNFREKMNTWSFYELQRQIDYKARWQGLPIEYVKANGTSSKCSECGAKLVSEENRVMMCNSCKTHIDRDINASRNILNRGMRFVPIAVQSEAVKQSKDVESIVPSWGSKP